MISNNAFNALLKTLEEPPKHVVFILATTEPHKIPLTILSRCQRFDFKPISNEAIVNRMKTIIDAEKVEVSEDALDAVALAAEGGMRDALSILDQAISYSEESVGLDDVLAVTGGVSQGVMTNMVSAMYDQSTQGALQLLDKMIQNGKDPGRFVYDMIYFMRDLLLFKSAPNLDGLLERARANDEFRELAEKLSNNWIEQAIIQLNQCQQEMKWTNSPKVFIEIAILSLTNRVQESAQAQGQVDTDAVIHLTQKIDRLEKELSQMKQNPGAMSAPAQAAPEKRRPARTSKNSYKIPFERIRDVLGKAEKPSLKQVQSAWPNFLAKLKGTNAPAHATIQDSKPAAASDEAVVVAFRYEIHCSLFLDHQSTVESILNTVLGKSVSIIPIPDKDWKELRTEYLQKQEQNPSDKPEEQDDPLVDEAKKLFGDDLVEIHD